MSETTPLTPSLSPGFARARKLSRLAAVLFTLAFLLMLSVAASAVVFVFYQKTPSGVGFGIGLTNGVRVGFGSLTRWQAVGSMVGVELFVIPIVMALYHTFRLFFCFAKGEVFATRPIHHIRSAGLWLMFSFFTDMLGAFVLDICGQKNLLLPIHLHFPRSVVALTMMYNDALFIGFATTIAAYVMEEARRIAADNAEIV